MLAVYTCTRDELAEHATKLIKNTLRREYGCTQFWPRLLGRCVLTKRTPSRN